MLVYDPQPVSEANPPVFKRATELNSFWSAFTGANADAIVHGKDENFAIADLAFFTGFGGGDDRINRWFDEVVVNSDLQLDFAEQVYGDFVAAIRADLPFLPTEALAIENRQSEYFDFG